LFSMSMPESRNHPPDTDDALRREVVAELVRDPRLHDSALDARVDGGVVTLSGSVDTYMKRWAADSVAYRVPGVKSVVNQIEVILPHTAERTDSQIAAGATIALESNASLEPKAVSVTVENGIVTLAGTVEWNFQREEAERVVRGLWGVRAVRNQITVRARAILAELKQQIQRALARTSESEGSNISVDTAGGKIVMRGTARTETQREAAERVAWSAPGVTEVQNEITLEPQAESGTEESHAERGRDI
jgi:osmotically-inducible protein OsmY